MEKYLVSARKYRPSTFASVVGQQALTTTLKNAVASHRLAHSYLFCGSRGVGKTSCARIFAKTINCEHPTPDGEACNECDSCREFNHGNSMNIVEIDAASNNGVDEMRRLTEQVQIPPSRGHYRVFIVDEVHMLSASAFNAFLKTLEEPPSYVVFILATTEKHKIIPTILSRCQIFDFHRITVPDITEHLARVAQSEGITFEPAALDVIAKKADGAMRDALSIFDQVAACAGGNITYTSAIESLNVLDYEYYNRLTDCFLRGDVLQSWVIYKEIRDRGFDSLFFINGLGAYMRDLMVARDPATLPLIEAGDDARRSMAAAASRCTPEFLYRAMSLCNDADLNYRISSNKQFLIELTLAKICQPLSPSHNDGSAGEGQLQPIAATGLKTPSPEATPTATPRSEKAPAPTPPVPDTVRTAPPSGTPKTDARKPHTQIKMPSFSIRHGSNAGGATAEGTSAASDTHRTSPFSPEDLAGAWQAYITAHPHAHILINTMRAASPTLTDRTTFTVTVQNAIQKDLMESSRRDILSFLHDSLSNDMVTYTVTINTSASPRHTLTDAELLKKMTSESAPLKKLVEDFKLQL